MFGGIIFQGTITSVTRTVVVPGINLRFYIDMLITNINPTEMGIRLNFIPKGEVKGARHVYMPSQGVPAQELGHLFGILLSSGDTIEMARLTISTTISTSPLPGEPLIYTVQARELVI